MQDFETVFDITKEQTNFNSIWPYFLFVFCALVIVGIGLVIAHKTSILGTGNNAIKRALVLAVFLFFGSIFIIVVSEKWMTYNEVGNIVKRGEVFVVEGELENYHAMPKEGHDWEQFDIKNVHFQFSDYVIGGLGYHNAVSLGGVITPNHYYRLTYCVVHTTDSNRILKIEVRK